MDTASDRRPRPPASTTGPTRRTTATGSSSVEGRVATLALDIAEDARHPPRLQAQAQQLRPRRRHRAARRAQPHPLRAPRGAHGDRHQRQGPHLLLGRQHLHARRLEPRLEGELLQVHQRDAQRHRGLLDALGPEVPRRGQRRLRRRRLRAGAGLRRDHPGRRPLVLGLAARGAAARRAARHRRPDPRDRQAPRAPRPRRHLLHQRRRRARPARGGLAPGRRHRQAGAVRRPSCRSAPPSSPSSSDRPAGAQGRRADAARARGSRPTASLRARRRRDRPRKRTATFTVKAPTGAQPADIAGDRSRRRRLVAAGDGAPARRRDPLDAHQRARHRHLAAQDRGRRRRPCSPPTRRCSRTRTTGSCARRIGLLRRTLRAPRRLVAQPVRADRAGLVLRRHAAELALAADRTYMLALPDDARARPEAQLERTQLRPLPDGHRPVAAWRAASTRKRRRSTPPAPPSARPLDADAALALGLVTAAPDDIDWDDEIRIAHRGARRDVARRAHRPGSQPALRRQGEHGHAHLRPPHRLAELDLPAARTRSATRARSRSTARARRPAST